VDVTPLFDSGKPSIVELCRLELTDECGGRHVLDRFYFDDAGNRAELPRMVAVDGGDFAAVCRLDFDLCNE